VLDPDFKPPPKAGVYAVRAGPILIQNLVAHLNGEALADYIPQTDFLKLLMCGDGTAIGFRFGIGEHTPWNKEAERSALNEARATSGSERAVMQAICAVQNDRPTPRCLPAICAERGALNALFCARLVQNYLLKLRAL